MTDRETFIEELMNLALPVDSVMELVDKYFVSKASVREAIGQQENPFFRGEWEGRNEMRNIILTSLGLSEEGKK